MSVWTDSGGIGDWAGGWCLLEWRSPVRLLSHTSQSSGRGRNQILHISQVDPVLLSSLLRVTAWVTTVAFSVALLPFRLHCTWLPELLSFLNHRSNSTTLLKMTSLLSFTVWHSSPSDWLESISLLGYFPKDFEPCLPSQCRWARHIGLPQVPNMSYTLLSCVLTHVLPPALLSFTLISFITWWDAFHSFFRAHLKCCLPWDSFSHSPCNPLSCCGGQWLFSSSEQTSANTFLQLCCGIVCLPWPWIMCFSTPSTQRISLREGYLMFPLVKTVGLGRGFSLIFHVEFILWIFIDCLLWASHYE